MIGTATGVDFLTLRRRENIYILVGIGMVADSSFVAKDSSNGAIASDVVVKLDVFAFSFERQSENSTRMERQLL